MGKILYIDMVCGISGDMFVGAMIDAGCDFELILRRLKELKLELPSIKCELVSVNHIKSRRFKVEDKSSYPKFHNFSEIRALIKNSSLNTREKELCIEIFHTLAKAEACVHNIPIEQIHFHEVGALDSIIDIVSAAITVVNADIEKVFCSEFKVGSGFVDISHGKIPVPVPAVMELIKGYPIKRLPLETEITTPTGAAIVKTLTKNYKGFPEMRVEKVGYGTGKKKFDEIPNFTRCIIGEEERDSSLYQIEFNVDDMNPQFFDLLMEECYRAGAVDIWITHGIGKKSRPMFTIGALVPASAKEKVSQVIFNNTSTIGLRYFPVKREKLRIEVKYIKYKEEQIKMKFAYLNDSLIKVIPEYEDCKRISIKYKIPLQKVYAYTLREI